MQSTGPLDINDAPSTTLTKHRVLQFFFFLSGQHYILQRTLASNDLITLYMEQNVVMVQICSTK